MSAGIIDTHNHLDCPRFDADRDRLVAEARAAGVVDALICAGFPEGFAAARNTAHATGWHYALGIHPLWLNQVGDLQEALSTVRAAVSAARSDPHLAAVGEIGLDYYVKDLDPKSQEELFVGQLKIARDFALPVSIHARHSVDAVSAAIRRIGVPGGVIHAFNGSWEQAQRFLKLGFKLGFGGAMLYSGSLRIRRVLAALPDDGWVLETDCPDMPAPARRQSADMRTHPADIASYAQEAANIRGISLPQAIAQSYANAQAAYPLITS